MVAMIRNNDRMHRRTALAQLIAATLFTAGAAKAQQLERSLTPIKATDLGRKTYMLEGLDGSGNVLIVIGDDAIIMVDCELAPLHDRLRAAVAGHSKLPVRYLVNTHFHGQQTGGNAPFHREGAVIVAHDNVRVRLLAGSTNGLKHNSTAPAHPDAIPAETFAGDTKTVAVRGRESLLTHVPNAHTDGDSWVYLPDANVIFTGDLFYNNRRYPMIDYANGGDIRGMVRANESFLRLARADTKIVSSRGGTVAGKAQVAEFRDMLATARDRMAALAGNGLSEEEVLAARPFADLDDKWAGSERDSVNFVRVVYNSFRRA